MTRKWNPRTTSSNDGWIGRISGSLSGASDDDGGSGCASGVGGPCGTSSPSLANQKGTSIAWKSAMIAMSATR